MTVVLSHEETEERFVLLAPAFVGGHQQVVNYSPFFTRGRGRAGPGWGAAMIGRRRIEELGGDFPALRTLDAAQVGVAADELDPGERLVAVEEIMVEGQHGVLIASTARLLAVYSTELLFKSFPTLQTLHYQHVLTAQATGSRVYVYASPHPSGHRDEFEENTFMFHTPQVAAAFVGFLRAHCPRLAGAAAFSAGGR